MKTEGAAFWTSVFTELKNRVVEDILIAVTDGLKGMTQAIEAVFSQAQHQTCIVHLIRASAAFVSHKDRKAVMAGLKPIYRANTPEEALAASTHLRQDATETPVTRESSRQDIPPARNSCTRCRVASS